MGLERGREREKQDNDMWNLYRKKMATKTTRIQNIGAEKGGLM